MAEQKLRMMAKTLLAHLRYVATCARKTMPALLARNAAQQPVVMPAMIQSFLRILCEFMYSLVFLVKNIFGFPCYSIIVSPPLEVCSISSKAGGLFCRWLQSEIFFLSSENHMKYINAICGQNEVLNVKDNTLLHRVDRYRLCLKGCV